MRSVLAKKNNNARERKNCVINMNLPSLSCFASELLHHGRQAGEEKKSEIWVVSGELALIAEEETNHL